MEEKKILFKEADLLKMVGRVIEKWKFILVVSFCFAVFGIVIALSTAKRYTAEIVVAPEIAGSPMNGSSIGSLASMVGMDLGIGANGDALYPMLYPDIVSSLPFLTSLFDVRVQNHEETADTTYYAYLKHYRKRTWLDTVKALPTRTINWIMSLLTSEPSVPSTPIFDPYMLSKEQTNLVEGLNASISIFVDKKTDVITLSFTDRDPRVAAIMVDTIMNRLQQEITLYRTKKSIDDCVYIERMCYEAKDSLDASQKRFADFVSHNRNVINEHVNIEKERLAADKDLKTTLYTQWAQQLLLAKAKVQEKTPVFVTLKPSTIPVNASSMGRAMRVIVYTFFGAVCAIVYVLMKDSIFSAWRKIMRKSDE